MNNIKKKYYIDSKWILHFFITIAFLFIIYHKYNCIVNKNSIKFVSFFALFMMAFQIICLRKRGKKMKSFEFWFILLSYLFMFGQIFLVGVFNVTNIYALGFSRPVLDQRYDVSIIYQSAIFIVACIQMIFLFFMLNNSKNEKDNFYETNNKMVFVTKILLIIGIPCHLIYSIRMIMEAQIYKSYESIADHIGLLDDFSNFMIYGIICLFFSNKISKKNAKFILIISTIYLLIVMMLTGDRRYQIVSIIVLFLSFIKSYNIKFSLKSIGLLVGGYLMLGVFYLLREVRTNDIMTLGAFITSYNNILFKSDTNFITQSLYEFGGSLYTVCLAIKFIPTFMKYKYGLTILSGIISIIPFGFLYNNSTIFLSGRLADELMHYGNTTVGGSLYADLYGNFGFTGGIIAAGILGIVMHFIFNISKSNDIEYTNAHYYILFYALLHLVRASFTEVIRTSVWGIIILYFLYNLKGSVKNDK